MCEKKQKKQAHLAFEEAIRGKIQGTRHAIKFISQMVGAFLQMRTSNLSVIANTIETEVKKGSVYKQLQRFLKSYEWRNSGFEEFQLELLEIGGKLDLVIDRTEWKFGKSWINLLTVSVYYRGVSIPVGWKAFSRKGNVSGKRHVILLRSVVNKLGRERIGKVFGDREFGNVEVFKYLFENDLDFCIRLKKSHLGDGMAFKELGVRQSLRMKYRSKKKLRVMGFEMGISSKKLTENEYLIVATKEIEVNSLNEYQKRWGIETLFGCLKSRGFDFEETHLSRRTRIERLMYILGLALSFALKTGNLKVKEKRLVKKNNGRAEKSLFRIGLDTLQNLLANLHLPIKLNEFNILAKLLSCA